MRRRNTIYSIKVLCLCAILTSCSVGPQFSRPEIKAPAHYHAAPDAQAGVILPAWREFFQDKTLLILVETALKENLDLAIAAARIEEAQALLGVVRADQFPELSFNGKASRRQESEEIVSFPVRLLNTFGLGVGASYEIDLWGRYRRATEAQRAELLSTAYAYESLRVSLIATVAQAYYELIDLDSRVAIAKRTVHNRQGATKLIGQRFQGGIVSELDLNQAQIEEASARASLAELERGLAKTENALNVLLGRTPLFIPRTKELGVDALKHSYALRVPTELLRHRPDILSAEETLRASVENIGVAEANRYPSISLFGFIGIGSRETDNLFQSSAKTWGFGGDLIGPWIDFGKRKSAVEATEARSVQAAKSYEQTFLRAVQEVEDALVDIRTFRDERAAREAQRKAASHAATLSRKRYDEGVTNYLEVLDIERSLFSAELDSARTQGRLMNAHIALFRALGGGWEEEDTK